MAKPIGQDAQRRYFQLLPSAMERLMKGAAKAGGQVIADEAVARSRSKEVADAVVNKPRNKDGVYGRVITVESGWPMAVATWLEYGTDPHFITVSESQSKGRTARRVNQQLRRERENGGDGSLVIGGKFVGGTVFHPGADPHPFMRPASDIKEAEAVAAAQAHITARLARFGLNVPDISEEDE